MELPFEHDSLELLNACAVALLPLSPVPSPQHENPFAQTEVLPAAENHRAWNPGGNATMRQVGGTFGADFGAVASDFLPDYSAGISVEALSRAVERDARRFDANG